MNNCKYAYEFIHDEFLNSENPVFPLRKDLIDQFSDNNKSFNMNDEVCCYWLLKYSLELYLLSELHPRCNLYEVSNIHRKLEDDLYERNELKEE